MTESFTSENNAFVAHSKTDLRESADSNVQTVWQIASAAPYQHKHAPSHPAKGGDFGSQVWIDPLVSPKEADYFRHHRAAPDIAAARELKTQVAEKGTSPDQSIIDAVKNNNPAGVYCTYADAFETHRITMAANKSMETGKVIAL